MYTDWELTRNKCLNFFTLQMKKVKDLLPKLPHKFNEVINVKHFNEIVSTNPGSL